MSAIIQSFRYAEQPPTDPAGAAGGPLMDPGPASGAKPPPGQEGPQCTDDLLAQWREADMAAANAEVIVTTALLRYSNHLGPPPEKTQIDEARKLRAVATSLLHQALQKIGPTQVGNTGLFCPDRTNDRHCFVRWGGSDWDPLGSTDGKHTACTC